MLAIGTAGQTGTHLRCVSHPVPLLSLSGFGTHRDIVPHCPVPSRPGNGGVGQTRQILVHPTQLFLHTFHVAEGVERRGNDAAEMGHL